MAFRMRAAWAILAITAIAATSAAAPEQWDFYGNARYGFSVCYPGSLLKPQGEPDNGDGNTFKSADGSVSVSAYANYGIEPDGGPKAIAEMYRISLKDAQQKGYKISYQVLKPSLFAFSGVAAAGTPKARVIYQKTFERPSDKLEVSIEAEYPESRKAQIDPVVAKMAACLEAGKPTT